MGRGQAPEQATPAVRRADEVTVTERFWEEMNAVWEGDLYRPAVEAEGIIIAGQGSGQTWMTLKHKNRKTQSAGKFLFFSENPAALLAVAEIELKYHGYEFAKITVKPSQTGEHCLCLMAIDPADKEALAARWPNMKFRGWKSHRQTREQRAIRRNADADPAAAPSAQQ